MSHLRCGDRERNPTLGSEYYCGRAQSQDGVDGFAGELDAEHYAEALFGRVILIRIAACPASSPTPEFRTMKRFALLLPLIFGCSRFVAAQETFDTPQTAAADPDFAVQGEYVADGRGAQVVALGEHLSLIHI